MESVEQRLRAEQVAHKKGYHVNEDGVVTSHRARAVKVRCDRGGYPRFNIRDGSRLRTVKVHQLVAYQRFGELMYTPGFEVRHLNGNQRDFKPKNIDIGTKSQNQMDKPEHVRRAAAQIAANARREQAQQTASVV